MRLVVISDTHGCHRNLVLPDGDVLVHAGDVCDQGERSHLEDYLDWSRDLPFTQHFLIRGNHDCDLASGGHLIDQLPGHITLLDRDLVSFQGVKFWGISTPANKRSEPWELMPPGVDVLVTHRPPHGILDRSHLLVSKGSYRLRQQVFAHCPRIHIFGHIHHSYGRVEKQGVQFVNASLYRSRSGTLVNAPVVIEC